MFHKYRGEQGSDIKMLYSEKAVSLRSISQRKQI